MSHQGHSPDNPPLSELLQSNKKEKKTCTLTAGRAAFFSVRMARFLLWDGSSSRASFPSKAVILTPVDCRAGAERSMASLFVLGPRLRLAPHSCYTASPTPLPKARSEDQSRAVCGLVFGLLRSEISNRSAENRRNDTSAALRVLGPSEASSLKQGMHLRTETSNLRRLVFCRGIKSLTMTNHQQTDKRRACQSQFNTANLRQMRCDLVSH